VQVIWCRSAVATATEARMTAFPQLEGALRTQDGFRLATSCLEGVGAGGVGGVDGAA
jgi:hypothetical protein